jgi:hypothetical protein
MTARNWLNITQQVSMLTVVAASMTIVMAMGDFDLSVGSMASLAGVVAAVLFTMGYPVWAAVSAAILVGPHRWRIERLSGQRHRHHAVHRDAGDAHDLLGHCLPGERRADDLRPRYPAGFSDFARGAIELGPGIRCPT